MYNVMLLHILATFASCTCSCGCSEIYRDVQLSYSTSLHKSQRTYINPPKIPSGRWHSPSSKVDSSVARRVASQSALALQHCGGSLTTQGSFPYSKLLPKQATAAIDHVQTLTFEGTGQIDQREQLGNQFLGARGGRDQNGD